MADTPLIDIFDLCVERLAAGETVEDCLRDYPDYADDLRGLLETGILVFQAQADPHNEQQAQAHTRLRIEEALQTDFAPHRGRNNMSTDLEPGKKKNTPLPLRRSAVWIGSAAAAVFTFAMGFTFAMSGSQPVGVMVADANFVLTATAFVAQATQDADTDGDTLSDRNEVNIWNTNPGLRDTDGDGWSDGDEINTRGTNPLVHDNEVMDAEEEAFILTATYYVLEITQTAQSQPIASATPAAVIQSDLGVDDDFILTATSYVLDMTETAQAVAGTQFSLAASAVPPATNTTTSTPTTTAVPTATRQFSLPTMASAGITPEMGGAVAQVGGDTAITGSVVVTSVASYDMMPPTFSSPMEAADKDKNLAGPGTIVEAPAAVVDELEREASADGYAEGRIDGTIPVPDPALSFAPTIVPPGDVRGLVEPLSPINMQQQLDPMKAGEIDDNAEWDTYAEFRRNYISSYGAWTVIDRDVSGRRIIKVIDAAGQPILGARVVVSMDQREISSTYTYATGMTLFFPNALEETKRRDEFQIVVNYDQYQAYYTLDLRKVGDIVEIQMPIVIVRQPNDAIENANAAQQNAEAAAENARTAEQNALLAAENAKAAAENATKAAENAASVPPALIEATLVPETMSTPIIR